MPGTRVRAYFITSNHPEKYYPEWASIDYATATEADYAKVCEVANAQFVKGDKNHGDRDPKINGAVCVFEVGENGNPHLHQFCCSKNAISFSALQKRFPHSEIEVAGGTVDEVLDYFHKRGSEANEAKAGTTRCKPVFWGECFVDNRGLWGNGVLEKIDGLLKGGYSPMEIYAQTPKFAFYASAIERTYNARRVSEIPSFREVNVEYHFGKTATGKTHEYIKLCEQGLADETYLVSGDYSHPWDDYDFARHSILFLDELRGKSFKTATLLGITDGYKMTLPARYANKYKNWSRVIITTVTPPEELFNDTFAGEDRSTQDVFEQFRRRLDLVVYHYVNDAFEGCDRYRTVSVPGSEYEGLRQMQNLATAQMLKEADECAKAEKLL